MDASSTICCSACDLREKSLYLAVRLLEMTGTAPPAGGYQAAQQALDSGAALRAFERIVAAQGARVLPPAAALHDVVTATADGRLREIDCWHMARVAKCAGAPAHPAAGVRLLHAVGDVVARGDPLFEIHRAERDAFRLGARLRHGTPGPGAVRILIEAETAGGRPHRRERQRRAPDRIRSSRCRMDQGRRAARVEAPPSAAPHHRCSLAATCHDTMLRPPAADYPGGGGSRMQTATLRRATDRMRGWPSRSAESSELSELRNMDGGSV